MAVFLAKNLCSVFSIIEKHCNRNGKNNKVPDKAKDIWNLTK